METTILKDPLEYYSEEMVNGTADGGCARASR